ncbi:hypothetical protein Tco_1388659 [Tanacetum coccineum]
MVRCAHKTCVGSSIQSLLLSSSRAFIPSPKILFALSTKPLACGCLTDAQLFTPIFEWVVLELLSVIRYYFPGNLTLPVPSGKVQEVPADCVSAGHVLISADRDRIC